MGDYPKSFKIYKRMDSLGYADAETYMRIGVFYAQSKQSDDALKYLYKAESLDSSLADVPLNIGVVIAMRDNAYDKALTYVLKAIKLDPSNVPAYNNASFYCLKMGDTVMADKYYARFTELSRMQQEQQVKE